MKQQTRKKVVRKQPRKDSRDKRVNYDNTRESKFEDDMRKASGFKDGRSNDIIWYARNQEMLRAAASLPFSTTIGMPQDFTSNNAVPGIMTIHWSPVCGGDANAPINQAARSIYSYIVHANSRNYNYNDPDLMVMILAGANVFAAIAMGLRAYGTMRQYSQENYYTPQALVRAMGFNFDDLRNNLSQMWFDLNELIARTKQIWIPNVMPVIERWFWMSSHIYTDGDSAKSQYYLFVPEQLYQYSATASEAGSSLQPKVWGHTSHYWSDYMQYVNEMIGALLNSEDRGIMFGDIMKAYGANAIYALNPISSDYAIQATYDKEVLTQIENLSAFGYKPGAVIQDQSTVTLVQQWPITNVADISDILLPPTIQVLNFHQTEAPTPEQIMIATRLKCAGIRYESYTGAPAPAAMISPETYGTEIVNSVYTWRNVWGSATPGLSDNIMSLVRPSTTSIAGASIVQWSAFDWAPWIYLDPAVVLPTAAYTDGDVQVGAALGDWDNYTYIEADVLAKMHRTAIYSEFGVPNI